MSTPPNDPVRIHSSSRFLPGAGPDRNTDRGTLQPCLLQPSPVVCPVPRGCLPIHFCCCCCAPLLCCSGGQVIDKLHELGLQYSEQQAASIFVQVAEAVAHLHEYGVLHRWVGGWSGGSACVILCWGVLSHQQRHPEGQLPSYLLYGMLIVRKYSVESLPVLTQGHQARECDVCVAARRAGASTHHGGPASGRQADAAGGEDACCEAC